MKNEKEMITLDDISIEKSELNRIESEYEKIHNVFDKVRDDVQKLVKEENEHLLRVNYEIKKRDELLLRQSKMAAMGELIGVIAHQLKQPLNAIALVAQDIKDANDSDELDDSYIDNSTKVTMEQVDFMAKTIDDFKNFFNPNKAKKEFSLKESISKSVKLLTPHYQKGNIKIYLECEDADIYGLESELQQVVLNIANNAKDALNEKKPQNPHISIKSTLKNNMAVLQIEDNAGGIPEEILDKIFDSYFTTKGEIGTGIGLYMAKMIVENSFYGTIGVKNKDEGAIFTITLPLAGNY